MTDIGLMTRDEFLKFRNSSGKIHPDNAYDFDVMTLNQDYSLQTVFWDDRFERLGYKPLTIKQNANGTLIYVDGALEGVVHNDTAYLGLNLPKNFFPFRASIREREIEIDPKSFKKVKHTSEVLPLVSNVARKTIDEHPHVMKRFKVGDYSFEMRAADKPYKRDKGQTIVITNEEGQIVAQASDEWGTTLLAVAREYRGYGLGKIIGKVWYDLNPSYMSGGFTPAGMRNATKIWEDRVRELLANGDYTRMIRNGEITREKVKEIVSSMGARSQPKEPRKHKPEPLFLIDDWFFVIYDKAFYEEQDEKFVYAHGLFQDDISGNAYLFALDYDRGFKKIATYIALQMIKNHGEKLLIASPPSDHVELDGFEDVEIDGDFASLTKDKIDLDLIKRFEKLFRTKHDRYDEAYHELLSIANSKWR